MRRCGFVGLICFANALTAADPLPAPTPVPDSITPELLQQLLRSPADHTAELPTTRDFETYIYVINGIDIIHAAGMKQLSMKIKMSGFPHTRFGEWYDMHAFEADYRKVRAANHHARVVLIGFDLGAYMVRAAAHRLLRDGFPVAMVGYVGGECLSNSEYTRPTEIPRIVNVMGKGLLKKTPDLPGASNVRIPVSNYALPCRPETFDALYLGLSGVAASAAASVAEFQPGIMKE